MKAPPYSSITSFSLITSTITLFPIRAYKRQILAKVLTLLGAGNSKNMPVTTGKRDMLYYEQSSQHLAGQWQLIYILIHARIKEAPCQLVTPVLH